MIKVKIKAFIFDRYARNEVASRLYVPLVASAGDVEKEARILLSVQGEDSTPGDSWPAYFNKKLRKFTTASRPPEPPRRQTGELQNSIVRRMVKKDEILVAATAPYAADLEYGRKNMKGPRPFIRPALDKALSRILRPFYKFLGR